MKTTIFSTLFASVISLSAFAQDVTTVNATSTEISDNLDLKAVASIFGDSQNLEDFERRLNDPKMQISNLDLNNDNQVDYLRVIETVEGNTHLIVLQSVLDRDVYQDVATIEVERDVHNNVQVQVVGDVYMYGPNYIYEPVYVQSPIIFTSFWIGSYHPYVSNWYWGYYPSYYSAWHPYPVYRYRRNVNVYINVHNHYNYVNVRRSDRAVALYNGRRANGYEREYPNRSFQQRHANVTNRYELDKTRTIRNAGVRSNNANGTRNSGTRNTKNTTAGGTRMQNSTPRATSGTRNSTGSRGNSGIKNQSASTPRQSSGTRIETTAPRANNTIKTRDNSQGVQMQTATPRANQSERAQQVQQRTSPQATAPRQQQAAAPRQNNPAAAQRENNNSRMQPAQNGGGGRQAQQRENAGGRR